MQKATHDFVLADIKQLQFIGESIRAQFDQPPILEKKPESTEKISRITKP